MPAHHASDRASIYLTDHPRDLTMSGHTYLSTSGYEFTGYSATAGFAPAASICRGFPALPASAARRSPPACSTARWSAFSPPRGPLLSRTRSRSCGIFGKARLEDDRYTIDGLSLIDALNTARNDQFTAQCPKVFLSQGFGGCLVPVAPNTVTGSLTSVSSAALFTDTARGEASDTFAAGTIRFTSGPNAGLKALEILSFASGGVIATFEPFYYLPQIGDNYTMVRGCRKRRQDCEAREGARDLQQHRQFRRLPVGSDQQRLRAVGAEMTADDLIRAARRCLATPFRHQGRVPARRSTCAGLLAEVARPTVARCAISRATARSPPAIRCCVPSMRSPT